MAAPKKERMKRKKASGPSGANAQAGILVRESEPGQIETWRAAAKRAKLTVTEWIRRMLDRAAAK